MNVLTAQIYADVNNYQHPLHGPSLGRIVNIKIED